MRLLDLDFLEAESADRGVQALANGQGFPFLRVLNLGAKEIYSRDFRQHGISALGAEYLSKSSHFPALRALNLAWHPLGNLGIKHILSSGNFPNLNWMDLSNTSATRVTKSLEQSVNLKNLGFLVMEGRGFAEASLRRLRRSENLPTLSELVIDGSGWNPAIPTVLKETPPWAVRTF